MRPYTRIVLKTGHASRTAVLAGLVVWALTAPASPLLAQARQDPYVRLPGPAKSEQRAMKNLSGQVVNEQHQPVAQAVVHLKNKRTSEVKTRIAGADGKFIIRGLDRETDYEVHAESQGAVSDKRSVSSFDDRDEVQVTLTLKPAK